MYLTVSSTRSHRLSHGVSSLSAPDAVIQRYLYTVDEAVVYLGKSRATIYRLLKGPNPLPHHNIRGCGVQFTQQDLDAILAQSARGKR